MKLTLFQSFVGGVIEPRGERFSALFRYALPELITNVLLYSLPILLDLWFVSRLESTPASAGLGSTNTFLHLMLKVAEALSVGTVILVGVHNGAKKYEAAGNALRDAFWTTVACGILVGTTLWFGASSVFAWYGVDDSVAALSVPFLRLRALGVAFQFVFFACIGFLRGIKDTKTPMQIYLFGTALFVVLDYVLIFGTPWTLPYGFAGSAWATVIQQAIMLITAVLYISYSKRTAVYKVYLIKGFASLREVITLVKVSAPVVIDKAVMAASYVWLCKMMANISTCSVASFCVVKEMERLALLPAIACAQVITFLVSNSIGARQWDVVRANIKKVLLIAMISVALIIGAIIFFSTTLVGLFDKKGDFSSLASRALPILSLLGFFDTLQLVLAGALRGAGDVQLVMMTRIVICFGVFMPLSWLFSHMAFEHDLLQFICVYGSFYLGSILMSIVYIYRFRTGRWTRVLHAEGLV